MSNKQINVGMVGYKFMGKAHSNAYSRIGMFFPETVTPVMKTICGRDRLAVEQAAEQFGWEGFVTDWKELLSDPAIELIDINAPSDAHKEIAIAAAKAGKHLFCEKPLALRSKGSIRFDFERLNELEVYFTDDDPDVQGFRRVLATDPVHAYMDAWWPPGHTIGYEHTLVHEIRELMEAIREDRQPVPNFADGVMCQQVLEAVDLSIAERRWVKISEL